MPRIAKSERERLMDNISRKIRHHYDDSRRERGIDCYTAAKAYGMTYGTLNNHLNCPESFTLGELVSIANTMNISLETLVREAAHG